MMAANPFDQFDAQSGNPFDQFDEQKPAKRAPSLLDRAGALANPLTTAMAVGDMLTGKQDSVDFNSAARHNLMRPLHGVAQLIQHGLAKATEGTTIGPALRQVADSDTAALAAKEAQYQADTPDSPASYAGATFGSLAPFAGGRVPQLLDTAGSRVAGLVTKTPGLPQKIVSGATQGALVGLTNPVTNGGDFWGEKSKDARVSSLIGGGLPIVSKLGSMAWNAGKGVVEPILSPDKPVGRFLRDAINPTPEQIAALRAPEQIVPGSTPSFAQVLATPEAVAVEKAFANTPEGKLAVENLANTNNAARLDVLRRIAGTEQDAIAAKEARTALTVPMRDKVFSSNQTQPVNVTDILAQLDGLSNSSLGTDPVVKSGVRDLRSMIEEYAAKTDLGKFTYTPSQAKALESGGAYVDPAVMDGIRQNVREFLSKNASNGVVASKQEAALEPVRSAITDAIDRANPGYRDYLAAFARASVPLNTFETVRPLVSAIDSRGLNSAGDPALTLTGINSALSKVDKAKFPIDPEALAALEAVQRDVQRASVSNSFRAPGSDTAYNLQAAAGLPSWIFGKSFQGGGLRNSATVGAGATFGSFLGGPVGAMLGAAVGAAPAAAKTRMQSALARAITDPAYAAQLLEGASRGGAAPRLPAAIRQQIPQLGLINSQ